MDCSFDKALGIAKAKYPHPINHYEEYRGYYVFEYANGTEYVGGDRSPIVIRKSDGRALNYAPVFFNMDEDAEDVGDILSEGTLPL
jgi:hypothetical protein